VIGGENVLAQKTLLSMRSMIVSMCMPRTGGRVSYLHSLILPFSPFNEARKLVIRD
jgi:hypothetical protein